MTNANQALKGLTPKEGVVLKSDLTVSLPFQEIEVLKTIDYKNKANAKGKVSGWQGYSIKFKESQRVVIVDAGELLGQSQKNNVALFELQNMDEYLLTASKLGYDADSKQWIIAKN